MKKMTVGQLSKIGLIALMLFFAVFLGFAILKGDSAEDSSAESVPQQEQDQQQQQQVQGPDPLEALYASEYYQSLTEEEQKVIAFPGPNATPEEREAHRLATEELATEGSSIDISSCRPDPIMLRATYGDTVTLINSEDEPRQIVFNRDTVIDVPANGETELVLDFETGPGLYGYGCDQNPFGVGGMIVQPEATE